MSFNLVSQLSELDKKRFENYIASYGIEEDFMGAEKYLQLWGTQKIKFYKMFGNKFIYKFPIKVAKNENIFQRQLDNLLNKPTGFTVKLASRIGSSLCLDKSIDIKSFRPIAMMFGDSANPVYADNKTNMDINFSLLDKKPLKVPAGTKVFRAIPKMLKYFSWEDLNEDFEQFRVEYSRILNDRMLEGKLCLSIHPLDFFTLSDNNEGWTSCFNVTNHGCYEVSTIEMLNSNNIICIYLESKKPWNFSPKDEVTGEYIRQGDEWMWDSKRFRQLCVITKDIIVNGKGYPFQNKNITELALNKIKELAEANLHWTYNFGMEPYKDMIHVGSNYRMNNVRDWICANKTTKHNIILDTMGAYNDWFNTNDAPYYWCFRNKVKKTKMIRVSGKSSCLCCGGNITVLNEDMQYSNNSGDYNERYSNTNCLICYDCNRARRCDYCNNVYGYYKTYSLKNGETFCKKCVETFLRRCPCCGKVFNPDKSSLKNMMFAKRGSEPIYICTQDFYCFRSSRYKLNLLDNDLSYSNDNKGNLAAIFMCDQCRENQEQDFEIVQTKVDRNRDYLSWCSHFETTISKDIWSQEKIEKYLFKNLQKVKLEDIKLN